MTFMLAKRRNIFDRLRHYQKNHGERRQTPPKKNRGWERGIDLLIFVNFLFNHFHKKSQVIERIPDLGKTFRDCRTSYSLRILDRKKISSFFK